MSRIGNKPIIVPEGIDVTLNGKVITVKGPKGTLTREITKPITVAVEGNEIKVLRTNDAYKNFSCDAGAYNRTFGRIYGQSCKYYDNKR